MKHSSESFDIEEGGLELPVDPAFCSEAPVVSMEVMIERNADFRRWFPQSVPTEEERLASKVHEEFVL